MAVEKSVTASVGTMVIGAHEWVRNAGSSDVYFFKVRSGDVDDAGTTGNAATLKAAADIKLASGEAITDIPGEWAVVCETGGSATLERGLGRPASPFGLNTPDGVAGWPVEDSSLRRRVTRLTRTPTYTDAMGSFDTDWTAQLNCTLSAYTGDDVMYTDDAVAANRQAMKITCTSSVGADSYCVARKTLSSEDWSGTFIGARLKIPEDSIDTIEQVVLRLSDGVDTVNYRLWARNVGAPDDFFWREAGWYWCEVGREFNSSGTEPDWSALTLQDVRVYTRSSYVVGTDPLPSVIIDVFQAIPQFTTPQVTVGFDDGLVTQLPFIQYMLSNAIYPTIYVPTEKIGSDDDTYMNWDQLRQLQDEGCVIGSHMHTYARPGSTGLETIDKIKADIAEARRQLEINGCGRNAGLFAAPRGIWVDPWWDDLRDYVYRARRIRSHGEVIGQSHMYDPRLGWTYNIDPTTAEFSAALTRIKTYPSLGEFAWHCNEDSDAYVSPADFKTEIDSLVTERASGNIEIKALPDLLAATSL
jgi:hypothetical protein